VEPNDRRPFRDPIPQFKGDAYLAAWVEDHIPGQFGYLGST
jgi:hypothetical protein